jgi:hypothetical protein
MNDIDYIGANELVFNTDNEKSIYSGGFSVNSIMMKAGMSPIMTVNNQFGGEGSLAATNKVSDLFESLVVPNWALSYNNRIIGGEYKERKEDEEESDEDINDDLHDKLLGLVKEDENKNIRKKRETRKNKNNIKKGSTKRRIK